MSSANKIEEAQFEHVCMYCGKLNLLEKHREVFFGLRDCIDDSVKENVKIKKENESFKNKTTRLETSIETLKDANTHLVMEYEEKLCSEKEACKGLQQKIEAFADYEKLQKDFKDLTEQYNTIVLKMESIIKQNTEVTFHKRTLEERVRELEQTPIESSIVSAEEPFVATVELETFRAKIKAELEKEYKSKIDDAKKELSQKYEDIRKTFVAKPEPLDQKKKA